MLVPYCSEVKDYYCPFLGLQFQKSHHNLQSFISKCLFVCLFVFLTLRMCPCHGTRPPSHTPKKVQAQDFFFALTPVNMSKTGYKKNMSLLFILLVFHSKYSQKSYLFIEVKLLKEKKTVDIKSI